MERVSDTVIILNHGEMVAQGPIQDILAWGQTGVFTMTVKGNAVEAEKRLRSHPWVTGVETLSKNGKITWQIRVTDPDAAEAQLIPLALAGGVTVCEFGRKVQNLEEAFLGIVEESNHERK